VGKMLLLLSFLVFSGTAPEFSSAATIHASVAASLTDAFKTMATEFTSTHQNVEIVANYGASGTLTRQIVQGAPADLFISANQQWLDYLVDQKAVDPGTIGTLAANRLVFVGVRGAAVSLADLPGMKRIAIGSPKSVPAGQYAEEVLKKAGLYDAMANGGRLVQTQDVRQALIYADRGEADGAFVYRTDALLAKEAVILFEVPAEMHAPITYPLALTTAGTMKPHVKAFLDYLHSPAARAVLAMYGFVVE